MTQHLMRGFTGKQVVRPLLPADLPSLHLANHPRLHEEETVELLATMPGLSQWHPESGEFVIVTPWRFRPELPGVHTLSAFRHERQLLAAAVRASEDAGKAGFILMDSYESRSPEFYRANAFERIEAVVTYNHVHPWHLAADLQAPIQQFAPLTASMIAPDSPLLALDHAAFPWLWWNGVEEFHRYLAMPLIELIVGMIDGEISSYIGMSHFRGWSHLDRIAVHPSLQGHGLGRETLRVAASRMIQVGARRMSLSTQASNSASRTLYESSGFRRSAMHDYGVYGRLFAPGLAAQQRFDGGVSG